MLTGAVINAGNNGGNNAGNNGGRRKQDRKTNAQASSRKGCMRGKGGPENASCTYKGVRQRTWGKWVSEIREPNRGSRVWLGTFNSAREAAIAYDAAARRLYGPHAHVNLPEETEAAPAPPPPPVADAGLAEAEQEARFQHAIQQMKKQQEYEQQMQLYMQQQQHQQYQQQQQQQHQQYQQHQEQQQQQHQQYQYQQQQQHQYQIKVESITLPELPDLNGRTQTGVKYLESTGDNNYVEVVPSNGNLNANLPEFDDSGLWSEAASTMDYVSQAIDPGIGAPSFNDTIGIELKHPLIA